LTHSESTLWVPLSMAEKEAVRRQLERLLETNHFKNSRRYPALLRYIVDETLEGRGEFLKERVLGVEVFGRPAGYDTAADPVVRVTVAEIRKRIAQYYHDEAHDAEMRIELLPGHYEAEFRPGRHPELHPEMEPQPPAVSATPLPGPLPSAVEPTVAVAPPPSAIHRHLSRWISAAAALLILLAVGGVFAWRALHPSALDQFWGGVVGAGHSVLICIPVAGGKYGPAAESRVTESTGEIRAVPTEVSDKLAPTTYLGLEMLGEDVVFADAQALANAVAVHHGTARNLLNTATNLDDLRQGPAVLIGALDNQWTLRAVSQLRYQFAGDTYEKYWIVDTKTGKPTPWFIDLKSPIGSVTHDYGIVARIRDQTTGQVEVVIAGIGMTGTAAASELLTNPQLIEQLRERVGPGFREANFEAVLATDVVNGSAGEPRILTVDVE
jgi:hypothetical protein